MADDAPTPGDAAGQKEGRWLASNTSVATRLALSALVISVASLVVASQVSLLDAEGSAERLLQERLSTIRTTKADEIEGFLAATRAEVGALAASAATPEALAEFREAYNELETLDRDAVANEAGEIGSWYLDEFIPRLEAVRMEAFPTEALLSASNAAIYLQSKYIAEGDLDFGDARLRSDAQDGSSWTEIHRDRHPGLLATVDRLGYADLYLIEPEANTVVYSTNKDIDFATSLDTGPQSDTALARLARQIRTNPEPGRVYAADFSRYQPALDQPSLFLAAPVFADGELAGIVAVRLSTAGFDEVMTFDWRQDRFGATGESYLVAGDGLMRSTSRTFLEDPAGYPARVDPDSLSDPDLVETLGTTVLNQEIGSRAVDAALAGDSGQIEATNYLGDEVYTAYQPVADPDLEWVVLTEQQRDEVDEPVTDLAREGLIVTALFVVVLTFLLVIWANTFVSPLRRISNVIERIRGGDLDAPVPAAGAREFRQLAASFEGMAADLAERRRRVSAAAAAKMNVLRRLLPPALVRSVEAGDRSLLETVPQATVAVVVVHGIDDLTATRPVAESRRLLHSAIDELDELAGANGLERVKVIADTYYAACGLATPYLDHAPRSVTFALQAREAVRRLVADAGAAVDLSAGVHLGAVNVGLAGEARLVYDLWGDTVNRAHQLARLAGPGQVVVSDEVRDRLPETRPTRPLVGTAGADAWVVTAAPVAEGAGE